MKRLLTLLILAFFLTGTPIQANAAPELSFDSAEVFQGQTASLNLSLAGGTEDYAGINVTIRLPENITFNTVSKGDLTDSGFTLDYSPDGSRIIVYSTSSTFSGNGILFSLSIKADDDASPGEQDIVFVTDSSGLLNPNALSNSDGSESVSPTLNDGKITILKMEDDDEDGFPDAWEQQIIDADISDSITTIEDVLPKDDFDGDGFTNLAEYDNSSDPTDSASPEITLTDAIIVLKVVCGIDDTGYGFPDMSGDGKTGLEEAIFILQKLGGI